ncbi:MAG TPA: outer membrane lipoprotein carrier protein LolA [Anaeromyxobacter sp.]|nr:outer membrane lipoprotein carrier protein LolA [Anaeromyxobacter sp.]
MPASRERRAIGCAVALAILAAGERARAAVAPPAAAAVAAHCRARAALSTLRARFVQTKVFAAIGEEDRSEGVVLYRKPDALRWEYTEPDRSWTVLRGGKGWAVFPRLRQVQRFSLEPSRAEALFSTIGFGACGEAFTDAFDIALAPGGGRGPVLALSPRRAELAGAFTRIELTLDPTDALPRRIFLHESTGDSVIFELRDVERGASIDRALFEYEVPKGYSVAQ